MRLSVKVLAQCSVASVAVPTANDMAKEVVISEDVIMKKAVPVILHEKAESA